MSALRLKKGLSYEMRVIRLEYKKNFWSNKWSKTLHVFSITLQDEVTGAQYDVESQLPEENQTVFKLGEMAKFYVSYDGASLDEIQPYKPDANVPLPAANNGPSAGKPITSDYTVNAAYRIAADVYIAEITNLPSKDLGMPADKIERLANQVLDAMMNSRKRVNNE